MTALKPNPLVLRRVTQELPRFAYRFANEVDLHSGISKVLTEAGLEFQHEFVAGPDDRFDFLLPTGIVIEAKTKGSLSQALGQCARYLKRDDVSTVVLVAARHWGRTAPRYVSRENEKQIQVLHLKGAAF